MSRPALMAAVFALALVSAAVLAHEGATGVVAQRMNSMKEIARHMKDLNAALKTHRSVTPEMVALAERIRRRGDDLHSLFPRGSHHGHTEAKLDVWREPKKFEAMVMAFDAEAEGLLAASQSGDYGRVKSQFSAVARQCQACHESFRASR